MLVKLALFYIFVQLDIVSFPQDGQYLVVDLSHSFVRVLDQLEDLHQNSTLVEDAFQAN